MLRLIKKSLFLFICFCVIFKSTDFAFGFNRPQAPELAPPETAAAPDQLRVEVNEMLLDALIRVESSNNPGAVNKNTQACGLTQIRPNAWKDLVKCYPSKYKNLNYKKDIFRPEVAREAGRDYLNLIKYYLDRKNLPVTLENILAAYNWGIGNLEKSGLDYAPRETRKYIQKIRLALNS